MSGRRALELFDRFVNRHPLVWLSGIFVAAALLEGLTGR